MMARDDELMTSGAAGAAEALADEDSAGAAEARQAAEPAGASGAEALQGAPSDESITPGADASGDASDLEVSERELAENNALARVFDDVRAQSRDGRLVIPAEWQERGFVPEHMAPGEFETFVFEYWNAVQHDLAEQAGQAPAEGEPCAHSGEGAEGRQSSLGRDAASPTARPRQSNVASSRISEVGVPPFLRGVQANASEEVAESGSAAARSDVASEADGQADVASRNAAVPSRAAAGTAESVVASFHDAAAAPENAASPAAEQEANAPALASSDFEGLRLPEGYQLVELEGEWVLVPDEDADQIELPVDCDDVVVLEGKQGRYLYDRTCMTDAYAHWAFLAAEDDDAVTFVDCVREESRTYPRPMPIETLENDPFRFSDERIFRIWDEVRMSGDYPDIQQTIASNGDIFFYSTRYLAPEYASSLAEWAAVERLRNV